MFKNNWLSSVLLLSCIVFVSTTEICGEFTGVLYNPETGRDEPVYNMMDEVFESMTKEERKELKEQEKLGAGKEV